MSLNNYGSSFPDSETPQFDGVLETEKKKVHSFPRQIREGEMCDLEHLHGTLVLILRNR